VLLGDLKVDPSRVVTATKFRRWIVNWWKPVSQLRVRQGLMACAPLSEGESPGGQGRARIDEFEPETNQAIPPCASTADRAFR